VTAALDTAGPAAPPRSNGELVFGEPWESRAFGMAVTLADAGAFTWDAFRDRLIARIAAWEAEHGVDDPGFRYYACWLDALEDVLVADHALADGDVAARSAQFADRPAGHDHGHDDGAHGHGH
jgi:nitrile hydratase accessory protein